MSGINNWQSIQHGIEQCLTTSRIKLAQPPEIHQSLQNIAICMGLLASKMTSAFLGLPRSVIFPEWSSKVLHLPKIKALKRILLPEL